AARSRVEVLGARQAFGGKVDSERRKLRDVFWACRISNRQRRTRRGNIGVQRKVRNRELDHGRSGILPPRWRRTFEERHVQSDPCHGRVETRGERTRASTVRRQSRI